MQILKIILILIALVLLAIIISRIYQMFLVNISGGAEHKRITAHVSGHPGSGKTTIGRIISSKNKNVVVIDTDILFEEHGVLKNMYLMLRNETPIDEIVSKTKTTMLDACKHMIEIYPNNSVVFVGISFFHINDTTYYVDLSDIVDYTYYIDIDMNTLMQRLFTRNIKNGMCLYCKTACSSKPFEKDVISGKLYVKPFSLDRLNIEKWNNSDKNMMVKEFNYKYMTQNNIVKDLLDKLKN
jgi:adenylate kinase family enzyme